MQEYYPVFFLSMAYIFSSVSQLPLWQVVVNSVGPGNIFVSLCTIIAACLPSIIRQFVRKEITYDIVLDIPINSQNGIFRIVKIELVNTGNENINQQDFVYPIEIDLKGRTVSVHSYPEIEQDSMIIPTAVHPHFFTLAASDKIKLAPFLFQKRERFSVKCVVRDEVGIGSITVDARINIGRVIRQKKKLYRNIKAVSSASIIFFAVMWSMHIVLGWFPGWSKLNVDSREPILLLLSTLSFAIISIWMHMQR